MINVAGLYRHIEAIYTGGTDKGSRHIFVSNLRATIQTEVAKALQSVDFYTAKLQTLNERALRDAMSGRQQCISKEYKVVARELRRATILVENLHKLDTDSFIQDVKTACTYSGGLMNETSVSGLVAETLVQVLEVE